MTKKYRPNAAVRMRVMKRDKFMCTYCGVSGNDTELEIDHIIPLSKGGSNHISNLTTSCMFCNRKKGNRVLEGNKRTEMSNALIGKFVHILRDGKIHNQGMIIEKDDDNILIQRFSFFDGEPTDIIAIPKTDLFNKEKCKIYASQPLFLRAYYEECYPEYDNDNIEKTIEWIMK
jgi:hypothetical protein